jgi:drug/metabolite transporter (DMT)-like permease
MNWDFIIALILGIVGAALIAGGIVAYRKSDSTRVKSFSAAAIAAGLVMWAAVAATTQVTSEVGGPGATPGPSIHVEGF